MNNESPLMGTRFIFLTRFLIFLISDRGRSNTGMVSLVVFPLSDPLLGFADAILK